MMIEIVVDLISIKMEIITREELNIMSLYEYTARFYPPSWKPFFGSSLTVNGKQMTIFELIHDISKKLMKNGVRIPFYPNVEDVYNSMLFTNYKNVKVVILGQDPYPGIGRRGEPIAMGLAFSVRDYEAVPKSQMKIRQEIELEGYQVAPHGDLTFWAVQGVLLINTALTLAPGKPKSHLQMWKPFIEHLIYFLVQKKENLVFMLWGREAQRFTTFIDKEKHLILMAGHPSPLNTSVEFLGCNHFTICNQYLEQRKIDPIEWSIDE